MNKVRNVRVNKVVKAGSSNRRGLQDRRVNRDKPANPTSDEAWTEAIRLKTTEAYERELGRALGKLSRIEQVLGEVLGYPRYSDEPERFPDAKPEDGVNVGFVGAERLAAQAAALIRSLQEQAKEKA